MRAILRFRNLPILFALLLSPAASAQVEVATWPLISDYPARLGQGQAGNVVVTENDINAIMILGATPIYFGTGAGNGSQQAVQTTDDSLVALGGGQTWLRKYSRTGELQRTVTYPIPLPFGIFGLAPLDDGKILAGFPDGYQVLDRFLAPVGPPIPRAFGGSVGFARRADGSIVSCEVNALLVAHLVAYDPGGSVLWNVPIPARGAVACTAGGTIYVAHGANATSLDAYGPYGAPLGNWTGPPGAPLYNIIDIASSRSGDLLYTLTFASGGPVRVFGSLPVATQRTSWGTVRALFR